MNISSKPESDPSVSKIPAIRETWIRAVQASDVDRLMTMVTDDVVVVQGNGVCACGKDEFKAYFHHRFGLFDMEPRVTSVESVVHDKWSFEVDEVESARTAVRGGAPVHSHFRIVVVFARQLDGSWKVARLLELLD